MDGDVNPPLQIMTTKDTSELARMGRRRFVNALASLGISGVTLNYMSQETLAKETDNLGDEVPYVAYLANNNPEAEYEDADRNGRAPIYRTLEFDKWVEIESIHNAARKLNQELSERFEDGEFLLSSVSSTVSGHRRKLVVTAQYTTIETATGETLEPSISYEEFVDSLSVEIEGGVGRDEYTHQRIFDVEPKKVTRTQTAHFDSEYRPVPGGCQATKKIDETSAEVMTTATPVYDSEDNDQQLVTSGHGLLSTDSDEVYQPLPDDQFGTTGEAIAESAFDAGIVDTDSYTHDIANSSGGTEGWPIDGIVTWDSIKSHVDDTDYELTVQGRSTGRETGYIYDTATGSASYQKAFGVSDTAKKGDSGGPAFRKTTDSYGNDWTYIAGVIGWQGEQDTTVCTAMEAVEDKFDVYIKSH
ncbi:hypothetical protein [Halopiger djelfimassiliensis]|uniref:hypothetical protein n=1 Tax=Halopiger djelfimassiliensis TaxID=1293047 RepID=UPI000AE4AFB7|nr:hypothetical protein [Halopiger djelfimassiliensis]